MRARIKSWFSWVFCRESSQQRYDVMIPTQVTEEDQTALCDDSLGFSKTSPPRSPGQPLTGPGSFHHAHDFVVHNPVFQGTTSNETEVMRKLTEHVLTGAEFDSSARDPPPRCHEGTRESLIAKIGSWLGDLYKPKKMLWLNGPAGVGKSAIMQTLAEVEAQIGRLGASLFFSRTDERHDPSKVLPTIAFQLTVISPSYRAYVVEQLTLNPLLLTKSIREQFYKFIVEPFAIRGLFPSSEARCILLDGLDECQGEDAQCNIIQLVSDFIRNYPTAPITWIIATRPEEHLKIKFAHPDTSPYHWRLHIPIDDTEACEDVQRYFQSAFAVIRNKYPNATSSDWPNEKEYSRLITAANGLFVFAFTIVLFLGDPGVSDPVSQLQIVLRVIESSGALSDDHPFAILDGLYTQILAPLHPTALRHVHRLLGYLLLRGYSSTLPDSEQPAYTLLSSSNILGLQPNLVYGALQKLHSVLYVPPRDRAHQQHIRFLHTSFADYLENKQRSKALALDLNGVHTHIWWCYYRIIQQADDETGDVTDRDHSRVSLSWPRDEVEETTHLAASLLREARYFWAHCLVPDCFCYPQFTSTPSSPTLISFTSIEQLDILRDINYNALSGNYCGSHVKHVFAFCRWLLGCWNSLREEVGHQKMMAEVPLQDFSLDGVDNRKLAWVSEGSFLGYYSIRHYSNHEKYHIRDSDCLDMGPLLSEVSSLKLNFPQTNVLVCENEISGRVAFVIHASTDDEYPEAFYFLPLV